MNPVEMASKCVGSELKNGLSFLDEKRFMLRHMKFAEEEWNGSRTDCVKMHHQIMKEIAKPQISMPNESAQIF